MLKLLKLAAEWLQINNTTEEDINNNLQEKDFYFIGIDMVSDIDTDYSKIYINEKFENYEQLKLMESKNGLEFLLPYWQGLNCIYIMYEPRLFELKTCAKIKAPKEYIYRGFYQICYKCPLDTDYRLAYYNYLRNEIRGDYKSILPYFNCSPRAI